MEAWEWTGKQKYLYFLWNYENEIHFPFYNVGLDLTEGEEREEWVGVEEGRKY